MTTYDDYDAADDDGTDDDDSDAAEDGGDDDDDDDDAGSFRPLVLMTILLPGNCPRACAKRSHGCKTIGPTEQLPTGVLFRPQPLNFRRSSTGRMA